MKDSFDINHELAMAFIGGGLILAPVFGMLPMIGILAAVGSVFYLADVINRHR